jgi:uncharacterized protein YodC (DUF2158 family)
MTTQELIERTIAEEDANKPISAGDLVHLKSGGPTMTVRSIVDEKIECEWFDKGGALKKHEFKLHSLRRGPHSLTPIISINFGTQSHEDNESPPWERDAESKNKDR